MVDARKERYGARDLKQLFQGARTITVARGKAEKVFDLQQDPPGRAELEKAVLGPTGNLRAPAIRMGKKWLIGFGEGPFGATFG